MSLASQNDLIDALECLASLAVMSGMNMEQKIRYAMADKCTRTRPRHNATLLHVLCRCIPRRNGDRPLTHTPIRQQTNVSHVLTNKLNYQQVKNSMAYSVTNARETGASALCACTFDPLQAHYQPLWNTACLSADTYSVSTTSTNQAYSQSMRQFWRCDQLFQGSASYAG